MQEGGSAALQALEEVGAAEPDETLASPGKVTDLPLLSLGGWRLRVIKHVIAEAVPGQVQVLNNVDHLRRVQLGVLVIGIGIVDGELDRLRHAGREERACPVLVGEELPPGLVVRLRVVFLNEAARAAHEVEPHQVAPVVGILAKVEGRQGARRGLVTPAELYLAQLPEEVFGPDSEVLVILHEDAQLAGKVEVGLVVGRRRQEDALALVGADVFLNGAVTPAPAVAKVVALVDDDQPVAAQVGQLAEHSAD